MIQLGENLLIHRGTSRVCYLHPSNPDLVIKVPFKKLKKGHIANVKEMKGYHYLMRRHTDLFCISHCYGFVTTDKGVGLVSDCIRDDDGAVAKTIWDIIVYQDDCDVTMVTTCAGELCDYLISRDIYLFDINLKNIILRVRQDGSYEPVVVDLKGRYDNQEFIPFSNYINYFSRKKLERRSRQLVERIAEFRQRRAELQAIDRQSAREI